MSSLVPPTVFKVSNNYLFFCLDFSIILGISRDISRFFSSIVIQMCIACFIYRYPDMFILLQSSIAFQICFFYCDLLSRHSYVCNHPLQSSYFLSIAILIKNFFSVDIYIYNLNMLRLLRFPIVF